jgi:hypothetical protein
MTFHFAPAVRESVTLLIALAGASGSGKTYSALRLAKGMAPTGKIAFIDTEARRGLHYAEEFQFLHTDMRPPFAPVRFIEAIRAAEDAGAEVVVIDSFSMEYDGEGGIMDWADQLEASGTKSPGNWKLPKRAHKNLMNALLQCRASVIFCLRADEKIRIARENGKTVVEQLGWMPICEKRFMFEMTASFTLTPDRPGIPHFDLPHKLQRQHRGMFTDTKPIGEDSGAALAEWARGGAPAPTTAQFRRTDDDVTGAVPTAAEYFLQWDKRIKDATRSEHIGRVWNADKALHKQIEWTSAHSYEDLKAKVLAAAESMRAAV